MKRRAAFRKNNRSQVHADGMGALGPKADHTRTSGRHKRAARDLRTKVRA